MPLSVAILITRLDLGGAQEAALETACRQDPARFDVRLLAGPGGLLDDEARARLGARLVLVPSLVHALAPFKDLAFLFWLTLWLRREKIQVLHTHSSKAGALGRFAAFLARTPRVVHTVHGWSFNDHQSAWARRAAQSVEGLLAHATDVLAVVAQSLRDKGLLLKVGRPSQYALLRAGVDLATWRATPRSRRALVERLPGLRKKVVGVVANMKAQKAPLDFVRVAAGVCAKHKDVDFVYVGDGPLKAETQALAQELGVADRFHALGWQRDPRKLAAAFDIFFLPSLHEGLPCVFPQALSLGLPVVASAVDGAAEVLSEGVNALLCQPHDLEAFADRLDMLLSDAGLRRRMAAAAKRSVSSEFNFDAMALRSAQIYEGAA